MTPDRDGSRVRGDAPGDALRPEPPRAQPVRRLVGLRVVVDAPDAVPHWWERDLSEAERVRRLEVWARELEEFIRDHHSQDRITLSVERDERTFCSSCDCEWEPVTEDGVTYCFGCGITAENR
jgi:hypothetical protein